MGQPEPRAAAAALAVPSRDAGSTALQDLLGLERRLAFARNAEDLRAALRLAPPGLRVAAAWALVRRDGAWEALAGGLPEAPPRPRTALEAVAEQALRLGPGALDETGAVEIDGHVCFLLIAGGSVVGVLGAPRAEAVAPGRRRLLGAVAAVLGLAVGHVRLLGARQALAAGDGLTGCSTRAAGMERLDRALEHARRTRKPLALLMVDLDDFKSVNDRHGHLGGDAVLAAVGARIRAITRSGDLRCRFGGDEFLVLLPDTPPAAAARVAEALRREIGRIAVRWRGAAVSTTASVGVASARAGETDARAFIARADAALYRAKGAGRNRVCAPLYSPRDDAVDAAARQRGD